jgi:hypothetical protein
MKTKIWIKQLKELFTDVHWLKLQVSGYLMFFTLIFGPLRL